MLLQASANATLLTAATPTVLVLLLAGCVANAGLLPLLLSCPNTSAAQVAHTRIAAATVTPSWDTAPRD
jgi:hypothetical protein